MLLSQWIRTFSLSLVQLLEIQSTKELVILTQPNLNNCNLENLQMAWHEQIHCQLKQTHIQNQLTGQLLKISNEQQKNCFLELKKRRNHFLIHLTVTEWHPVLRKKMKNYTLANEDSYHRKLGKYSKRWIRKNNKYALNENINQIID